MNNQLQYDSVSQKRIFNLLTKYKTYGKIKTGYENVSLKTLFEKLDYYKRNIFAFNKLIELEKIYAEFQNRFLQKMGAPSVNVKHFFNTTPMLAYVGSTDFQPAHENINLYINALYLHHLNPFNIFHECRHLCQHYNLDKIVNGNEIENNQKFIAFCLLFSHLYKDDALPYNLKVEELDANLYAYTINKQLIKKGYIKLQPDDEYFNTINIFSVLTDLEYKKDNYNKNFTKIIKFFNKSKKYIKQTNLIDENLKKVLDSINPKLFVRYANRVLGEMYDDVYVFLKTKHSDKKDFFLPNGEINYSYQNHNFLVNQFKKYEKESNKQFLNNQIAKLFL